ncbi:hypothetical protein ACO0LG_22000 [Undibacterium sp. Ji42W]|uniref:hypothetical protein n=1 Tax=Undibacterium sp. Ji42W TaxID=3413039 RepID=UPI003BF35773
MPSETHAPFPTLDQLLTGGGDARIALDDDGYNKYGCGIVPDNLSLAFGSATASTISDMARSAANVVYQKLASVNGGAEYYPLIENELELVRQELKQLCALTVQAKSADLATTDVVFAASGTDLHLIAAQMLALSSQASQSALPMLVIMVEPGETGSSVPAALSGQHFSSRSALDVTVISGDVIAGTLPTELQTVSIREKDGSARNLKDVDAEVVALTGAAIAQHRHVMLVLADVSKTGMIAPSINVAINLSKRHRHNFHVMVDACQFRISNASLHAYLQQGFLVAVTGSKFLSGPSFSGALFVPASIAKKLKILSVPLALQAYSSRADWPREWPGADKLSRHVNAGLLLRWVAALAELRAFRQLPEAAIHHFVLQFGHAIQSYFEHNAHLALLPVYIPKRDVLHGNVSWDQLPTIFSFLMKDTSGQHFLDREQTMLVYRRLQKEKHMQSGQPVLCGLRHQIPVSALRLCLSARLIVSAIAGEGDGAEKVIEDALLVLDTAAQLAAQPESV